MAELAAENFPKYMYGTAKKLKKPGLIRPDPDILQGKNPRIRIDQKPPRIGYRIAEEKTGSGP